MHKHATEVSDMITLWRPNESIELCISHGVGCSKTYSFREDTEVLTNNINKETKMYNRDGRIEAYKRLAKQEIDYRIDAYRDQRSDDRAELRKDRLETLKSKNSKLIKEVSDARKVLEEKASALENKGLAFYGNEVVLSYKENKKFNDESKVHKAIRKADMDLVKAETFEEIDTVLEYMEELPK